MNTATARLASLVAAATLAVVPLAAPAQPVNSPAETIDGTIRSVQNANHISLNDDRGFIDDVTIRTNAGVAPSGLRLVPGQRVRLTGSADRGTFVAENVTSLAPSYASAEAAAAYTIPAYYPAPFYPAPLIYPAPVYRPFPVSIGLFFRFR